jgi:hypothetical protein
VWKQCVEGKDEEQNQVKMIRKNDSVLKMKGRSNGRSKELAMECPVQGLLKDSQISYRHVQPLIEPDLQGEENGSVEYDCNDADGFAPTWFPKGALLLFPGVHHLVFLQRSSISRFIF